MTSTKGVRASVKVEMLTKKIKIGKTKNNEKKHSSQH
jgi:hypothetical protein